MFKRNEPEQAIVQLNVRVPYDYREMLTREAEDRSMSINALVREALDERYAARYVREQTKRAGSTS